MLISMLVTLVIITLLLTGIPSPGELVGIGIGVLVAWPVLLFLRNRVADGLVGTMLTGGRPASSAAEMHTDIAEGYCQQQEYDAALYAYGEALRRAKGPQRAPIMLRLAETAVLAERGDEALDWWGRALRLRKGLTADQRAGALFRMAEVLHGGKGDPAEAARLLKRVCEEFPGSKYAGFASERLRELARKHAAS